MSDLEGDENKPNKPNEKKKLKIDAVAADGVLEMLNAPIPTGSTPNRPRTLSMGTRADLDAQIHQRQFQSHRSALERHLSMLIEALKRVLDLNRESALQVPVSGLEVLNVNVKLGSSSLGVAGHAPDVIEQRILQVLKHSDRLGQRLSDSRSRVLVTGDVNAGKSSLCNAFLRRRVLPVDQQPCTDVFCEVIDASQNGGVEEVHAISLEDKAPVEHFMLHELADIVHCSDKYRLLLVYVKDPRPPSESLLANGVVDICLIDAPGLNVNAVTTSELFGRQEEIDLVIFVVSAENHFTQSAQEFVADAAREKSLLFIAVNNFDRIRDKDRCRDRVLKQLSELAPETRKGAADFVHFGSFSDNGEDPDPNNPEFDPNDPDLEALEASLRNFVLDKRSASKLAPAKTYILNVLKDLRLICSTNRENAKDEHEQLSKQLAELLPEIQNNVSEFAAVSERLERDTERLVTKLQEETEQQLGIAVSGIGEQPLVPWPGLLGVFSYAHETRTALVEQVLTAVAHAEDNARDVTANAVSAIKQLGILHAGDHSAFHLVFQKNAMFSRRKDNLSRHITAEFNIMDVLDFGSLLERPLPVLQSSKAALLSAQYSASTAVTSLALTAASVAVSSLLPLASSIAPVYRIIRDFDLKRVAVPVTVLTAIGLGAYAVYELPRTIPRRMARKIAFEIDELGYVRSNAGRIAGEARKVLRYPAQDVRSALQSELEKRTRQRDEFERHIKQADQINTVLTEIHEYVEGDLEKVQQIAL